MITADNYKHIHLLGIGGAGMSGLAKHLVSKGIKVSGQDSVTSETTLDLSTQYSISIDYGDESTLPSDTDMVIYSRAVPGTDKQRKMAAAHDIQQFSYPEFLGKVIDNTYTIAVAGTNGKTTTTSMIVELFDNQKKPFNAIVGADLQKFSTNYISNNADTFVIEACEYKNSFLNYTFDVLVVTNITEDHLDFFDDLEDIQRSFMSLIDNAKDGAVVICDTTLRALAPIVAYAQKNNVSVINYHEYISGTKVSIPGDHNINNAAAALGVVDYLALDISKARQYLESEFKGAKRRLEYLGVTQHGALVFDDYAHNPEGLHFLIAGIKERYPQKNIVMLFEPHLYSRTRDFKEEFAVELQQVDELYLFATYRAREDHDPKEDFLLAQYIDTQVVTLHTVENAQSFQQQFDSQQYASDTIIISAGAGDIWKHSHPLVKKHSH